MTEATLLLALRLIGGAVLLSFLFGLAWLVYRDLQVTSRVLLSEQGAQGHLRVVHTAEAGPPLDALYPMLTVTRIGRSPVNTIVLDDAFVSAEHAVLERREKRWWLEDLHSRNGTLLNDLPLSETAVVGTGDVITIGEVQLRIEAAGES